MKYDIIIGTTLEHLQKKTAIKLAEGWQLDGKAIQKESKPRKNGEAADSSIMYSQIIKTSQRVRNAKRRR